MQVTIKFNTDLWKLQPGQEPREYIADGLSSAFVWLDAHQIEMLEVRETEDGEIIVLHHHGDGQTDPECILSVLPEEV